MKIRKYGRTREMRLNKACGDMVHLTNPQELGEKFQPTGASSLRMWSKLYESFISKYLLEIPWLKVNMEIEIIVIVTRTSCCYGDIPTGVEVLVQWKARLVLQEIRLIQHHMCHLRHQLLEQSSWKRLRKDIKRRVRGRSWRSFTDGAPRPLTSLAAREPGPRRQANDALTQSTLEITSLTRLIKKKFPWRCWSQDEGQITP